MHSSRILYGSTVRVVAAQAAEQAVRHERGLVMEHAFCSYWNEDCVGVIIGRNMLSERLLLLSAAFCAAAAAVIPLSTDITASTHWPSSTQG